MPGRNPFNRAAPPAAEAAAVPVENAEIQFCGTFGDGDAKRFNVYNVTKQRSVWLKLGEVGPDELVVESYDADEGLVQVRQGAQSLTLGLQAARVAGGARPLATASGPATGNRIVDTVKVNPTPADERRRLEAVAAEVRRRREMRQAAAAKSGGGRR